MYVWLPLPAPPPTGPRLTAKKGPPARLPESASAGGTPELQLHLRLQWVRQVERGQIMHLDFSLEGCGISVVGWADCLSLSSVLLHTSTHPHSLPLVSFVRLYQPLQGSPWHLMLGHICSLRCAK